MCPRSLALHHQLFCLTKLDVTSDGSDELIVTSWDGHTFIINQARGRLGREDVLRRRAVFYSRWDGQFVICRSN